MKEKSFIFVSIGENVLLQEAHLFRRENHLFFVVSRKRNPFRF